MHRTRIGRSARAPADRRCRGRRYAACAAVHARITPLLGGHRARELLSTRRAQLPVEHARRLRAARRSAAARMTGASERSPRTRRPDAARHAARAERDRTRSRRADDVARHDRAAQHRRSPFAPRAVCRLTEGRRAVTASRRRRRTRAMRARLLSMLDHGPGAVLCARNRDACDADQTRARAAVRSCVRWTMSAPARLSARPGGAGLTFDAAPFRRRGLVVVLGLVVLVVRRRARSGSSGTYSTGAAAFVVPRLPARPHRDQFSVETGPGARRRRAPGALSTLVVVRTRAVAAVQVAHAPAVAVESPARRAHVTRPCRSPGPRSRANARNFRRSFDLDFAGAHRNPPIHQPRHAGASFRRVRP